MSGGAFNSHGVAGGGGGTCISAKTLQGGCAAEAGAGTHACGGVQQVPTGDPGARSSSVRGTEGEKRRGGGRQAPGRHAAGRRDWCEPQLHSHPPPPPPPHLGCAIPSCVLSCFPAGWGRGWRCPASVLCWLRLQHCYEDDGLWGQHLRRLKAMARRGSHARVSGRGWRAQGRAHPVLLETSLQDTCAWPATCASWAGTFAMQTVQTTPPPICPAAPRAPACGAYCLLLLSRPPPRPQLQAGPASPRPLP